jgi:hypothetical protein
MPVTVWLRSGESRVVKEADGADTDGSFIWFTAPDDREGCDRRTVLTLHVRDVDRVEIETAGKVTRIIPPK